MNRANYVIACWMGRRGNEDRRQVEDRSFFLRTHLSRLKELDHRLAQVTVVIATGADPRDEEYVRALVRVRDVPIVVLERENLGLSYGSWNFAYETFGREFTHYVLVEDDYIPCSDHFDEALIDIAERKRSYVCSLSGWDKRHAAISNSISSSSILGKLLPAPVKEDGWGAQITWSQHFYDCGFPVEDWTDTHSSPFWSGWEVRWYGHPSLPPMFVPIQALGNEVGICDGSARLVASLDRSGRVEPSTPEDAATWKELLATNRHDNRWEFPPSRTGK